MKNDMLDEIFFEMITANLEDNPTENHFINSRYNDFCKEHGFTEWSEIELELSEIIDEYRRLSFRAGFETAKQLLK
jgi:hypothetical protein